MRIEHWVYTVPLRLRSLLRRGRVENELDEELRYHLERQVEENIARGMSEEEARYAARRAMGGIEQHKEACRDARRTRFVEDAFQDIRYGFRTLLKNPGFALVSILTLGLGIGANTAVFSVINAVFLRPLPYHEPERLVVVWEDATAVGYPKNNLAPGNFLDVKASNTVFEDMAALRPLDLSLTGDGEPERVKALGITTNMLPLLGVEPLLGRSFLPEEGQPGGALAVLVSYGLWQRRYAGSQDIVGREVSLNGVSVPVTGVMPPGFQILEREADVWVPMAFSPQAAMNRGSHYLVALARLEPGVTVEQAQSETQVIMERIGREFPEEAEGVGATVVSIREEVSGDARRPLLVLLVAVALVLLIACMNVGNLMLSRAAARSREIAIRAALGAGRWRTARQLFVENVPLVVAGTAVGLALAFWSVAFLRQLVPPGLGPSAELGLDWRVLGFTLAIAVASLVLFGLVPALQASKADLNETLRSGGARSGVSTGGRLRAVLVVGEVSLAIALLVGASLLIQTFFLLRAQYAELQLSGVLTMKTILSQTAYDTHQKREAFFERALERVRALPGVVAAGYTNALPLDYRGDSTGFSVQGVAPDPGTRNNANTRLVTEGYLEALGVPLRAGRHFAASDGPGAQPVAIVNETMARKYFPGGEALGRRFKIGPPDAETPWVTVVGIAADVRQNGVDTPAYPEMYFPYRQTTYLEIFAPKTLAIRTSGDATPIASAVRREIAAIDPNQPVSDVMTMGNVLGKATSERQLGVLMLGAFAAVALLLASIGIYGLLSQLVAQKRAEIGVRLALGATPRDVVGMVVGRGMTLVLVGTVAGLLIALALVRLIESLLFGVGAADPLTLAGVPVLLAAVALVACYVPARRAARVDPNLALRYE